MEKLTGEYRIAVFNENFTTKHKVEAERNYGISRDNDGLAEKVSQKIKARLGVKPKEVVVLESGELPRATHKTKRLIDLR
jgi:phenylacetate-CoA ligase